MKATEQCFPVVLFITLYKFVIIFESVSDIKVLLIQIKSYREEVFCDGGRFSIFDRIN